MLARMTHALARLSLRWKITLLVAVCAAATAVLEGWLATRGPDSTLSGTTAAVLVGVAMVLAASILAYLAARVLVRPVLALRDAARSIAGGDLTGAFEIAADGELADLSESFSQAAQQLRRFLVELSLTSATTQRGAGDIQASVARLAAMSAQQAAAINETTTTASEIAQTSKQATEHANSVIEITQRSDDLSRAGLNTVEEAVKASAHLGEQVNRIAATVAELSQRTQQVGEIISSVKDLAEQSNLLALNAAIEASKAGEHGRGFSVVAMEMRNLAEQSRQAAVQVRSILQEIQRGAREAAAATDEGAKRAGATVTLSRSAGQAIEGLAMVIKDSALAARQIAANTRQQTIGVEQIVSAIAELSTAINESAEGTRVIEQGSASLSAVSRQLAEAVARYKV
jgi:methyl-accepting chemotaxis protein